MCVCVQRFSTNNAFKRTVLDMIANELLIQHMQQQAQLQQQQQQLAMQNYLAATGGKMIKTGSQGAVGSAGSQVSWHDTLCMQCCPYKLERCETVSPLWLYVCVRVYVCVFVCAGRRAVGGSWGWYRPYKSHYGRCVITLRDNKVSTQLRVMCCQASCSMSHVITHSGSWGFEQADS